VNCRQFAAETQAATSPQRKAKGRVMYQRRPSADADPGFPKTSSQSRVHTISLSCSLPMCKSDPCSLQFASLTCKIAPPTCKLHIPPSPPTVSILPQFFGFFIRAIRVIRGSIPLPSQFPLFAPVKISSLRLRSFVFFCGKFLSRSYALCHSSFTYSFVICGLSFVIPP
jgi:hypothetical protein